MAGVQTSIQLQDRMSAVLNHITQSMSAMMNTFEAAQATAGQGLDAAAWESARQEIAGASAAVIQYREELERAQNIPVKAPEPPTWNSAASQPVFMDAGADRFASEFQAADQMAKQLYARQQAISAQARGMRVTPPGMLNDVVTVENRMQRLANRIQQLNNIPMNLRTDQTNNELESLRGKLSQAVTVQERLNVAMKRMDISAANTAYQQLNVIMDNTERDIRDNLTAQEQFNQAVKGGQAAAKGLEGTIRRYGAALLSVATAGKAISLADQVTQTTARLDLMNYGLDTTEQLQQKIFQSAQRSRGAYQTTANAVAKLGMQARGAFSSNDELIAFAEQLNKSFVIAGTSVQGVDSVMLQLTQSMASGKLQGEELNAILDNAQPIVQNIADYMGVPVGQIKQLASEGAISAEIIKNAMFAAADETNAKFEQMPMTFGQVSNSIKNQALMAFQPALQQLSAVTQTEGFQALTDNISNAIEVIASGAVQALDMLGQAALFVQNTWGVIEPIIWGVAGAVGFYALAMGVSAIAEGIHAAATWLAVEANRALIVTLLSNPLLWVAVAIGVIVAAIVRWIQSVGGIKVAWLTCVNAVLTMADRLKIGFITVWNNIQNRIDDMQYGFAAFKTGVLNVLGNLKVKGLTILQDFINGAIDRVNAFIEAVNSIAGTSIKAVVPVEFATNAAVEEAANQQRRASDLAALRDQNIADKKARAQSQYWMNYEANQNRLERERNIAAAKAAIEEESAKHAAEENPYGPATVPLEDIAGNTGNTAGNTGNTAANTAAMADSMDILDEDLKYLRDAAEQEMINRFTLAELKVDVNNNNTLKTETDFDDVNRMLGMVTAQILAAAAEGGHI